MTSLNDTNVNSDLGVNSIFNLIDVTEINFIKTLLYSVVCMILWTVLPHLQMKFNLLSKLIGNDNGKAADFLAYVMIYSGCLRNYTFTEAVNHNLKVDFGAMNILVFIIGYSLIIFGLFIVALSFYRLGLRGMYFGDYFGFLFKEKIVNFPYDIMENPQYIGTCSFFFGVSMTHLSPAGLVLTLFINLTYQILNHFESRNLAIFYPPNNESSKTN